MKQLKMELKFGLMMSNQKFSNEIKERKISTCVKDMHHKNECFPIKVAEEGI